MDSLSPFLQGSFIPCSMPVYPGALKRRARANVSTVPAPENRRADVPLGSNSLKHRIQILS
jgi:hypothetical protein